MGRVMVWVLAALLAAAPASSALARGDDDDEGEQDEAASDDEGESTSDDAEAGDGEGGDADAEDGDAESGEDGDGDGDDTDKASEAAAVRQWYFGPYFRYVFVPAFMLELFLDEAPTVANAAFGVAATYRTIDRPMFEIGAGYTSYAFEDPFRAKGDPNTDTEWVDSDLGLVHLTGSILWTKPIVEQKLFFDYGIGLDIGIVTGDLVRTEAYFVDAAHEYAPCNGPLNPDVNYCRQPNNAAAGTDAYDQDGEHYGVVEERVPPIGLLPMLPRLGLRYEPIPELAVKLEAAYGIAQIWLGLSAAYAPEM